MGAIMSKNNSLILTCLLLFFIFMSQACTYSLSKSASPLNHSRQTKNLIQINYEAADKLLGSISDQELFADLHDYPLLIANFVNLQDLEQTSSLGRTIPQQIGARLTQLGFKLVDIRLRSNSLLVREKDGEFGLSREVKEINKGIQGYAVLVGTYTVLYGEIFVNARILRSSDALVLATADYTLPVTPQAFPGGQAPAETHQSIQPTVRTQL